MYVYSFLSVIPRLYWKEYWWANYIRLSEEVCQGTILFPFSWRKLCLYFLQVHSKLHLEFLASSAEQLENSNLPVYELIAYLQ